MQSLHKLKCIIQFSRKNKRTQSVVLLLPKTKLNLLEFLISKVLNNSYISHDEFISVNKVLRENNATRKQIKNPKTSAKYTIKYG